MTSPATEPKKRPFDSQAEERALAERAQSLLERARSEAVDECEVFGVRYETIAVRLEKGDLKLTQVDDGSSLGLRVFRDKRLGFASTNRDDEESLAQLARDAASLAAINPPDEANVLPAPRAVTTSLQLVQPELAGLGVERVVELGRDFVDRALAVDPRIAVDSAEVTVQCGARALLTGAGLQETESDAALSFQIFGMAVDGDDVGGFHYTGDCLRELDQVEPAMASCLAEFTETVLGNLSAGESESYRGPVLFSADAFFDIFIAPFLGAASAIAVQRGRSPLAGKLGAQVADARLSITDEPLDVGLQGAGAFDREGQPCARYEIVREGMLAGYLYNGYAAAMEGRASTGHAAGGSRGLPGLGPHAVVVAPGDGGDASAMQRALGRGLYVGRFSGSVDPASGDFSGVAKAARWIESGAVVRPVRETLLSGNTFELARRILSLSSDSQRLFGSARAPAAIVDEISVTAG